MEYFALFYDVGADFLARRTAYRAEHLSLARQAHARSELVLAGALADPADRALLVFRSAGPSVVEDFACKDLPPHVGRPRSPAIGCSKPAPGRLRRRVRPHFNGPEMPTDDSVRARFFGET